MSCLSRYYGYNELYSRFLLGKVVVGENLKGGGRMRISWRRERISHTHIHVYDLRNIHSIDLNASIS